MNAAALSYCGYEEGNGRTLERLGYLGKHQASPTTNPKYISVQSKRFPVGMTRPNPF